MGGGILVYIRNGYTIIKQKTLDNIEAIYFQIKVKNNVINFISCYKAPNINDIIFLDELEDFIFTLNLDSDLIMLGDLNMNLLEEKECNNNLLEFLFNNNLKQFVTEPTRICTKYYERLNEYITSTSLIDVIIHNNELIKDVKNIGCPFSDHHFILGELKLIASVASKEFFFGRNLSIKNTSMITDQLISCDFSELNKAGDVNERWLILRSLILNIIDTIAPIKKIFIKNHNYFPWIDIELNDAKNDRDKAYKIFKISKLDSDYTIFDNLKKIYNDLNKDKMISYFKDKTPKDMKNSKRFWEFYSTFVKIKSHKDNHSSSSTIKNGDELITSSGEISDVFNIFFTSLTSNSSANLDECKLFSDQIFDENTDLKNKNINEFNFKQVDNKTVENLFNNMNPSSGPGASGISVKILKSASHILIPIFTALFNECIATNLIPFEWKSSVVTPLFKSKGEKDDLNNYRGISVLPPISKLFEKVLTEQIVDHLNKNKILHPGQHGFRSDHSCETALHEIVSDMIEILSKRLIGIFMFVDFRKAFDLVDSNLLINKLKHYGFGENAIKLITNYFTDRTQCVKYDNFISSLRSIILSVPQGSVLGPLFFLIFINDLPFYVKSLNCKMFADDTTLYKSMNDLNELIDTFKIDINRLTDWCKYNRVDINWSKTFIMFITNKRKINIPLTICVDGALIQVVDSFKLLGVTIDRKLNFMKYACDIRKEINKRTHSIKKLFYLPSAVKLQFLKTFILPCFDYCSTLQIYFSKATLQKLSNCYNWCIYKLLGLNEIVVSNLDFNKLNCKLEDYGLNCFQHRTIIRLRSFTFKLFNYNNAPINLKNKFKFNIDLNKSYDLRNINQLQTPRVSGFNKHGSNTFAFFFSTFINKFCIDDLFLLQTTYNNRSFNNVNLQFIKFVTFFPKFDLNYKYFYD